MVSEWGLVGQGGEAESPCIQVVLSALSLMCAVSGGLSRQGRERPPRDKVIPEGFPGGVARARPGPEGVGRKVLPRGQAEPHKAGQHGVG